MTISGFKKNVTNTVPSGRNPTQPFKVPITNSSGNFTVRLEFDGEKNEPDVIVNVPVELLLKL